MIKLVVISTIVLSAIIMTIYESTGIGFNIIDYLTIR